MKKINKKQLIQLAQHFSFWLAAFVISLKLFTTSSEIMKVDYIYTFLFLITISFGVYSNLQLLVPRFLQKAKYGLYIPLFFVNIAFWSWFNILFFDKLVDYVLPGYYFISYYSFIDICCFVLAFTGITTLLKMARSWFLLAETDRKLAQMQQLQTATELNALRAQINPHFLFNSLNSIYSLVLSRNEKASDAVLRLSDILRYTIYDTRDDFVPLQKELTYLNDYIELQRLRSRSGAQIQFKIEGETTDRKIAPLLFIPLVENAFKHGIRSDTDHAFVYVNFLVKEDYLCLIVSNNRGVVADAVVEEGSGVGLENVRRRLELIYPGKHQLEISSDKVQFNVKLTVQDF
jgi:hypothetical protein